MLLLQPANWDGCRFRFRNKVLNEYADGAFSEGTSEDSLRSGRITMRALYLLPEGPDEQALCDREIALEKKRRKMV